MFPTKEISDTLLIEYVIICIYLVVGVLCITQYDVVSCLNVDIQWFAHAPLRQGTKVLIRFPALIIYVCVSYVSCEAICKLNVVAVLQAIA